MGDRSPTTQVPNRSREAKYYGTVTSVIQSLVLSFNIDVLLQT